MRVDGRRIMGARSLKALAAVCVLAAGVSAQSIWHVDASALPGGNGSGWTTAFDSVDAALGVATTADQIWVKAGVYKPATLTDPADPRSASFIVDRQLLLGGFAGWETTLAQRAGFFRTTVLSGDIGIPGVVSDNAYHVVTARRSAQLDGFTIRDGNAAGAIEERGGGVYGEIVSITGGGQGPTISLARCLLLGNRAPNRGGALYAQLAHVLLESCYFKGNESDRGGALCVNASNLDAYNCQFVRNRGVLRGGAVFFFSDNGSPPRNTFSNCVFAHNQSNEGGAAYLLGAQVTSGSATWAHCTFTRNSALVQGGAILAHDGPTTLADPVNQIQNSIVWGNSAPLDPNLSGLAQPVFSIIEGWVGGPASVYDLDPLFVDPVGGNYRLQAGSPAIDGGSLMFLRADLADLDSNGITNEFVPFDLDGRPRATDDPSVASGTAPYLDMGAYER